MKAVLHSVRWKLKQTFATAHGAVDARDALIVELQAKGRSGFGEAVAVEYYGVDLEKMQRAWSHLLPLIDDYTFVNPKELYDHLLPHIKGRRFLLNALDCAAHDLYGKIRNQTTRNFLSISGNQPPNSLTIGIQPLSSVREFIERNPWPVYKIKLGTENDRAIIETVRAKTDVPLWVDANSGWTLNKTVEMNTFLTDHGVEFIEQPLPAANQEDIMKLHQMDTLPILADESIQTETDLEFCLKYYDGINIKLMKCGGITPALLMIQKAREYVKKVMLGCMTESAIGISAAAQLISLVDYVDLDGMLMIANGPNTGVKVTPQQVVLSEQPGNGIDESLQIASL